MRLTSGHVCTCPLVKNESSESIPFIKQRRPTPLLLATDGQFAVLVPANFRQALSQSGAIKRCYGLTYAHVQCLDPKTGPSDDDEISWSKTLSEACRYLHYLLQCWKCDDAADLDHH